MGQDETLSCSSCAEVADARLADVMVCEGCLDRFHAACWTGTCPCGSAVAFGPIGKNDLPASKEEPVFFEPVFQASRKSRRGLARVGAFALLGLGAVTLVSSREPRPLEPSRSASSDDVPAVDTTRARADALFDEARRHDLAEEWDAAIAGYTRVIEVSPTHAVAWGNRGWCRGNKADWDGLIADTTRSIELNPNEGHAWVNRGWGYRMKGDLETARASVTQAITHDPGYPGGWYARGYQRGILGDYRGSIEDCTKAIALQADRAYAWNNRGYARMHLGDLAGASEDIEQSLKLDPKNAYAWENRGHLRELQGNDFGAMSDFRRSLKVDACHERTAAVQKALDRLQAKVDFDVVPKADGETR
jgi:tetratricopeptide (TPR) repeat protein